MAPEETLGGTPAPAPAPERKRSGLLKRLPFFVFLAVGLGLWKGGLFPQERELVWRLSDERPALTGLEIQLYDGEGHLLKREEFFFQAMPAQVVQKVPLKEGHYTARLFLTRPGRTTTEARTRDLEIRGDEAYALGL